MNLQLCFWNLSGVGQLKRMKNDMGIMGIKTHTVFLPVQHVLLIITASLLYSSANECLCRVINNSRFNGAAMPIGGGHWLRVNRECCCAPTLIVRCE